MDFERYREYPIVGSTVFAEPVGGLYGWSFVAFSVVYMLWTFVDGRYMVGILAGGSLLLLSVPNVLPEERYSLAVALRIVGMVYYVALFVAIFLLFPDAPTFFEGDW